MGLAITQPTRPLLYDSRGHALQASVYQGADNYYYNTRPSATFYYNRSHNREFDSLLSNNDIENLYSISRGIFFNVGPIRKAITDLAGLAVTDGWYPIFSSKDDEWNTIARQFIVNQWMPVCDYYGSSHFLHLMYLLVIWTAVDGDVLCSWTTSDDGMFPMLQLIHAPSISGRGNVYKNKEVDKGCILSRKHKLVGYYIQGRTPDDDYVINPRESLMNYEATMFGAYRGVSDIAPVVNDVRNYKDICELYKKVVKMQTMYPIAINSPHTINELADQIGERTKNSGQASESTEPIYNKTIDGPEVFAVTGQNSEIKFHDGRSPTLEVMEFTKHILRSAYAGMDWFYEMFDSTQLNGAATKMLNANVQRKVAKKQAMLYRFWKNAIWRAVAIGMKNNYLPYNKEWYKVEPTLPRKSSIDAGRDLRASIEAIKFGLTNHDIECGVDGYSSDEVLEGKARYLRKVKDVAEKYGLTPSELLQVGPNPSELGITSEPKK